MAPADHDQPPPFLCPWSCGRLILVETIYKICVRGCYKQENRPSPTWRRWLEPGAGKMPPLKRLHLLRVLSLLPDANSWISSESPAVTPWVQSTTFFVTKEYPNSGSSVRPTASSSVSPVTSRGTDMVTSSESFDRALGGGSAVC